VDHRDKPGDNDLVLWRASLVISHPELFSARTVVGPH